jgi:hypothetical protein
VDREIAAIFPTVEATDEAKLHCPRYPFEIIDQELADTGRGGED